MLIWLRWQQRPWLSTMSWWKRQKLWVSWWRPTRCWEKRRTRWSKNCSRLKLRYHFHFVVKCSGCVEFDVHSCTMLCSISILSQLSHPVSFSSTSVLFRCKRWSQTSCHCSRQTLSWVRRVACCKQRRGYWKRRSNAGRLGHRSVKKVEAKLIMLPMWREKVYLSSEIWLSSFI